VKGSSLLRKEVASLDLTPLPDPFTFTDLYLYLSTTTHSDRPSFPVPEKKSIRCAVLLPVTPPEFLGAMRTYPHGSAANPWFAGRKVFLRLQ
jgi:hypothetical protein